MKTETQLKQQIALLTKVLDEVHAYNEKYTSVVHCIHHEDIRKLLKPYHDAKIQPWTKWEKCGRVYMLCHIDTKYQLNALDGYSSWGFPADTPLGAFANNFHEFTAVED
jgi:hypothetical protein